MAYVECLCPFYGTQFTPEKTVFVDESSFDRRTSVRASRAVFGAMWSILSGKTVDAFIDILGKVLFFNCPVQNLEVFRVESSTLEGR